MIWIKRFGQGILSIAILLAAALTSADETKLIYLKHRPATEVIPLVQALLGPNDAVTGTNYQLIVRTSDKNFRELEKLLAQLDTARRQFRISVRQTVAGDGNTSSIGVSGEIGNDNVHLHLPRNTPPDDRSGVVQKNGLRLETRQTRTTTSNDTSQFVSVLDGTPAFIRVGQSVPHVQTILAITNHQVILAQGTTLHDIVTGFDVTPYAQGDNVLIQITPRLSSLYNPTTRLADFQQYSTTVAISPGQWVDIGGLDGNGATVRRAILDSTTTQTSEHRTILLKIE